VAAGGKEEWERGMTFQQRPSVVLSLVCQLNLAGDWKPTALHLRAYCWQTIIALAREEEKSYLHQLLVLGRNKSENFPFGIPRTQTNHHLHWRTPLGLKSLVLMINFTLSRFSTQRWSEKIGKKKTIAWQTLT
jgi:hypothetical protein